MLDAHDKANEKTMEWARTIHIPTGDIATTDFGLDDKAKKFLYRSGFAAADEYMKANKEQLIYAASLQDAGLFESVDRFRKLSKECADTIFKPYEIKRSVTVERPNAEMEVYEDLTNLSELPQHQVTRPITTDAPTEKKDLGVKAWITVDGVETDASVEVQPSKDRRFFTIRIGFNGHVIAAGAKVQLRWKCKFPGAVALDDDYWVFPQVFYQRRPDRLVVDATFAKIPADILFFTLTDAGLRPMNLLGPSPKDDQGKTLYRYSATIDSPSDFYVLRWRTD